MSPSRAPAREAPGKRRRWHLAGWLFPLLAAAFLVWLVQPIPAERSANLAPPPPAAEEVATPITTARVERSDLPLYAEATGYLESSRRIEVKTESAGKVVWRGVEEGQRVAGGAVLVRLFDRDRQIEFAEAEADLLRVQADYAVFVDNRGEQRRGDEDEPGKEREQLATETAGAFQRAQGLFEQGLIAEADLRAARRRHEAARMLTGARQADVQAATTGLTQAEQRVERARLALERTVVTAPFAGRAADVDVEVGQQLGAGERCLVLLDESRMTVDVDVLEADVVALRPGAPAQVRVPALGERSASGRVASINPQVDPTTGTGRATVVIDNPDGALMPGLFAFVELETRRLGGRLTVPAEAVLERQGRQLVFRIEGGRALWSYVTTGARSGGRVEIVEGLAEGDLVAVGGHFALAHEVPVISQEAAWKPPSAP